ncbi:TetR/AcrR family transcriptional regulator [Sphingobium tyrosinilyticum]|uniref:TetR/AcrR family transcriptional regulator n=1 Tax=Sphingobium tyrosinilyticum TaxID=2715436 RepID=A0ABV9F720_9SPHN
MRLLDRAPASGLSLRTIAREVGVAPPSVYSQFPDARAMLEFVARECWQQLADAMGLAEDQCAESATSLKRLKAQLAGFVSYAMERPSRYQLLFGFLVDTGALPDEPGLLQPVYRSVLRGVRAIGDDGMPFAADDPITATLQIISLAHGRVALAHLAPRHPGNTPAAIIAFVHSAIERLFD